MEAADILGVGRNQAYKAAHEGVIPVLHLGGRLLVPKAALERLLAKGVRLEPAGHPGAETEATN